jgi:hypothetical protein
MDRSAIDTIKGYFYQFDYSILSLLNLTTSGESIEIECVEDIDVNTATETTAIQCKYYAKTEYNHSVIKEPIMYMLTHFRDLKASSRKSINYLLRGYYESGQDKITMPIDIDFLKKNFLTYTRTEDVDGVKTKVMHAHHDDLGLTDADLNEFLTYLKIDVNAEEFSAQFKSICNKLRSEFGSTDFSAEYFYYNNALRVIKDLSINPLAKDRTITRKAFVDLIDKKNLLFNEWFVQIKGIKAHLAALRKEYFTFVNISPFERVFLIEPDITKDSQNDLVEVLHMIAKKWSKLTKRDTIPFCPYVYIHRISGSQLVTIKSQLMAEGILINDGYSFLGADFNVEIVTKQANHTNGIKLKVLSSIDDITSILEAITKRRFVYQFYLTEPFFEVSIANITDIKIQVAQLSDIKQII